MNSKVDHVEPSILSDELLTSHFTIRFVPKAGDIETGVTPNTITLSSLLW